MTHTPTQTALWPVPLPTRIFQPPSGAARARLWQPLDDWTRHALLRPS
jgi:hypothetical protein